MLCMHTVMRLESHSKIGPQPHLKIAFEEESCTAPMRYSHVMTGEHCKFDAATGCALLHITDSFVASYTARFMRRRQEHPGEAAGRRKVCSGFTSGSVIYGNSMQG